MQRLLIIALILNLVSVPFAREPTRLAAAVDEIGSLISQTDGIVATRQYDALNRLTNLVHQSSQNVIASYSYGLLPSGHRQATLEQLNFGGAIRAISRAYTYDSTYRLTREELAAAGIPELPASASVDYVLDDVGNRLTRTSTLPAGGNQLFSYDANDRLAGDIYDDNGNTISSGGNVDQYDFEDRLINRNNGQITIVYDGDGNRVRKTAGGITMHYLVDDLNPTGYKQQGKRVKRILATFKVDGAGLDEAEQWLIDIVKKALRQETEAPLSRNANPDNKLANRQESSGNTNRQSAPHVQIIWT